MSSGLAKRLASRFKTIREVALARTENTLRDRDVAPFGTVGVLPNELDGPPPNLPRGASVVARRYKLAVIRKEKGEYCVKSPNNPDWNGGCYPSKEKAEQRLQEVEYFKHNK